MSKYHSQAPLNQRFGRVFEATGLTQVEFGGRIGKSQNQISNILNDRSNVTGDMIQLLRYRFNVNPEYMQSGDPPMFLEPVDAASCLIPVLDDIPEGHWRSWIDSCHAYNCKKDYVAVTGMDSTNMFAVRMRGDAMAPQVGDRDLLIIDPCRTFRGGLAVVSRTKSYKVRFVRDMGVNGYLLVPINPSSKIEKLPRDHSTRFFVPVKIVTVRDA